MSYRSTGTNDELTPGQIARYTLGGLVALIAVIAVVVTGFAGIGAFDSIDGGHIAVLRNGGLSNQNIRGFLDPGAGMSWTGFFSTEHVYPAQQQVYTISSDAKQGSTPTSDSIDVPSSDGVDITIDGSLYYSLDTHHAVLSQFDNQYGTQVYSWNGKALHPYDGADGWDAFVNAVVRPTLQNELRTAMAQVTCADVDAACALVKNSTTPQTAAQVALGAANNGNLGRIQGQINSELATDLKTQLGGTYLTNLRFTISTVTLPSTVQSAIDSAQAAFAQVSTAQAKVNAANLQAQANEITQRGYAQCPACAIIAEEQALPSGITTYAPGAALAVGGH